jgi:PleD family two-component response regulator
VTASLGLAYYPAGDVETPEDLVHSADGALYGAKRSGKNRYSAVRPMQPQATA